MLDAAVLVHSRKVGRRLTDLGMRADDKEWPLPVAGSEAEGTWLAMAARFEGEAWSRNSYNELVSSAQAHCEGVAAIAVTGDRFFAVVAPENDAEPAVWIASGAVDDDAGARSVHGSFGAIRAAAGAESETVRLVGAGWTLDLVEIQRIYGDRYQEGQAGALLKAIGEMHGISGDRPEPPAVNREWRQEARRGGLYRVVVNGQPGASSSLVDREASRDAQIAALEQVTWAPRRKRDALTRWTANELLPPLLADPLPDDRVSPPFGGMSGWWVEPELEPHPVSQHLWPFVTADGDLRPDEGEHVVCTVPLASMVEQGIADDGSHTSGVVNVPSLYSPCVVLTNRRLAMLGDSGKEGAPSERWGLNVRHEWISEIGIVRRLYPPRKGLLREKPREFKDFAYVRCRLPSGATIEFRFGLPEGQDIAAFVARMTEQIISEPDRLLTSESTTRREHAINRFASYIDEHSGREVANAVPVSLPAVL